MGRFATWYRWLLTGVLASLTLYLAACGSTVTIQRVITPTPGTTTAVAVASPSATSAPAPKSCTDALSGAKPVAAGSAFQDVPFPSNTVGTAPVQKSAGPGQFTVSLFSACTNGTTADAVKAFFTAQMVSSGWTQATRIAFDGQYQQSCGDPYCWLKDRAPRYVSLENVKDLGNTIVSFDIRLLTPPTAPRCDDATYPDPPYLASMPGHDDIPLPPLSLVNAEGTVNNAVQNRVCSAGSVDGLNAFYQTYLTKLGWKQGTYTAPDGKPSCASSSGVPFIGWVSKDGSHALKVSFDGGKVYSNIGASYFITLCN